VIAAAFKLWPAFPLLVLLAARPARIAIGALTASLVLIATIAILGLHAFGDWMRFGLPGLQAETIIPDNVSLIALAGRLGLHAPAALRTLFPLAAAVGAALALRRQPPRLRAVLTGVAAMIGAPICWWYYAPVLLIPGALWWGGRETAASPRGPAP
jgi:hypothetical protein